MTFDPEVMQYTKAIIHYLLSFHRLSETFFAALPHDLQLREAEWDAIEDTVLALQHTVNVTVGQLLDALNALRGEWTSCQWEGVVLGLLMAGRPTCLACTPWWRTPGYVYKHSRCCCSTRQTREESEEERWQWRLTRH